VASVLVVDDEFGVAEVLQAILEDEGHRVMTAIHGRAALERMAEERPDLVLTDYMMPVMDGAALVAAMKRDPKLAEIPVVLMSSLPEASVAEKCDGHVGFMRKPFRVADVLDLLDSVLTDERRRA
jgi:CheY-like chemotaxis protein